MLRGRDLQSGIRSFEDFREPAEKKCAFFDSVARFLLPCPALELCGKL
jgi:hypothetical protein